MRNGSCLIAPRPRLGVVPWASSLAPPPPRTWAGSVEVERLCNVTLSSYVDFSGVSLRYKASLLNVSFPGGTNLLRVLANGSRERIGREITLDGCQFRTADVPAGLEAARLGITPLIESDPCGAEG